jgi:hypothetical protein
MSFETETYKGHEIKIEQDLNPESPREWDNLCIIHTAHRNYSIGDVNHNDRESIKAAEREAKQNGDLVLPLYMFDHSGITIALTPFSCRWDSGQVGFVQVPRKAMMEEFGKKIFTSQLKQKGRKIAEGEVETLDVYIRGEVCGYTVDDDGDSCWGFYSVKDAIQEAKGSIDWTVTEAKKKHCEQLKTWIKNKVPFEYRTTLSTALSVE